MNQNEKTKFVLEGKTNDLLFVNGNGSIKATRLVRVDESTSIENDEIVDVAVTSTSNNGRHELFDGLLGKTIRITVEEL